MQNIESLREVMRAKFALQEFRGRQEIVFSHLLAGRSGLLVMPTGGGKSLLYQLWAAADAGLVLVLSPLVSLMQDQVDLAKQMGLRATCLNATVPREERDQRLRQVASGQIELLFVTPERFRQPEFRAILQARRPRLLAVDEAHCISAWGHDFRPDYTRLGEIRELLENPLTIALTATATPVVQKEILSELRIEDGFCEVDSIERPELGLHVHESYGLDEKIRQVVGLRYQTQGAVLVYGSLISTLHKVADELGRVGLGPMIYHGQLRGGDRKRILREFQASPDALMLATPAFGLGINKPDIRAVIHLEMPLAIESYFQEVGRAGRDGQPAAGHLLLDADDATIQMDFIKWGNPDAGFVKSVYRLIENNAQRAAQEGADYLREQMNFYNKRDFRVETSLNLLEKWGCLIFAQNRLGFEAEREPTDVDLAGLKTEQRLRVQNTKLHQMLEWARNTQACRMVRIQEYFGETKPQDCGRCDVCLAPANFQAK